MRRVILSSLLLASLANASIAGTTCIDFNPCNAYLLGTNLSPITKGGLISSSGTSAIGILAVGSDTQILTADSSQPLGIKWAAAGASGASAALDNLASVNINTSLLAQTGADLGSTTKPFRDIYFFGSGTYSTTYFKLTGTPTAARTITFPNNSFTVAATNVDNAFSAVQTFNAGAGFASNLYVTLGTTAVGNLMSVLATTPYAPFLQPGTSSNSWHVAEAADYTFDFNNGNCATSACTDPSFWIHSHNQNTAQWGGFWHDATDFNIKTGTGKVKIGNILSVTNQITSTGTAPAVSNTTANSCGTTAAAIAGTDTTGIITVGATSGTSCTITFVSAAPTRRQCWATDETTAVLTRFIYLSTTTGKIDGVFTAGDTLEYGCLTY